MPEPLLAALARLHGPLEAPTTVARLAQGVAALQMGLTQDRARFAGGSYLERADLRAAYQTYYLCANAPKLWPALDRLAAHLPEPFSVVELGGGPGTGVVGVGLWARANGRTVQHTLTDHRAANLQAAQALAAALDLPVQTRLLDLTAPDWAAPPADLALMMNVVNELPATADAGLVALLDRLVSPDGFALALEPAAAEPSRRALALRDALVAGGWHAHLPCPHSRPCPALAAGDWCHASWAFERPAFMAAVDRAVGTRRDLLQATWFAVSRATPQGRVDARVVAEPRREKGRTRARVCLADGSLTHLELQKRDRSPENIAFNDAELHAGLRFTGADPAGHDTLRLPPGGAVEVLP